MTDTTDRLASSTSRARRRSLAGWAATASVMLALVGCGGGSGGDAAPSSTTVAPPPAAAGNGTGSATGAGTVSAPPVPGGNSALQAGGISGTGRSVFAYGQISAFGSVWVNGVRYTSSSAIITKDGVQVTESALRVGMVVRLDGTLDDSRAVAIGVSTPLRGAVSAVLDSNRLIVLGQVVQVDDRTHFENGVRPAVGDLAEVHGHALGDGRFEASYVERKASLATSSVKGLVAQHDATARRFRVGTLVVDYGQATLERMPATSWNGLVVEVEGAACAPSSSCSTLVATKVQALDADTSASTRAEVEGAINTVGANDFVVGNRTVRWSASTRFEGGSAEDLIAGTVVEAEGSVEGGLLSATKVIFRDNVRLEGNVSALAGPSLELAGLSGIKASTSTLTQWKGFSRDNADALALHQHIRARGRSMRDGTVAITELELRSTRGDDRIVLRGPVSASSPYDSISMLAHVADVRSIADAEFYGGNQQVIGRVAFFSQLRQGTIIKLQGALSAGLARWESAELED